MDMLLVDAQLWRKREMLAVANELHLAPKDNLMAWMLLWGWFSANVSEFDGNDGVLRDISLESLSDIVGIPGYAEAHAKPERWLLVAPDGTIRIRNHARWNGKGAKSRYLDNRRKAASRASERKAAGPKPDTCPVLNRTEPGQNPENGPFSGPEPDSNRTDVRQPTGQKPDHSTVQDSINIIPPNPPAGGDEGGDSDSSDWTADPEWLPALEALCQDTGLARERVPPTARRWSPEQLEALRQNIAADAIAGKIARPAGYAATSLAKAPDSLDNVSTRSARSTADRQAEKARLQEEATAQRRRDDELAEWRQRQDQANEDEFERRPELQAAWEAYSRDWLARERAKGGVIPPERRLLTERRFWLRNQLEM